MKGVEHALCHAHHLRALQSLAAFDKEDRARRMQRLLRRARSIARLARGCDRLLVEAMECREGLPPFALPGKRGARRRRKGRNPALRLHARYARAKGSAAPGAGGGAEGTKRR